MKKLNLSKFETLLWTVSVVVVTASFLISPSKDYLTLLASIIGVSALIFISKGYVIGQILTVLFSVFYGIISWTFKYYGEMITYLGMTAPMAILSTISWIRHPYEGSMEVAVRRLRRHHVVSMFLLGAAVTAAFYIILRLLGNSNLLFSTISITTSFIASYLTYLRSPYYAIGYAANDVILIILWILASTADISYLPMVLCFTMFLANDLYGFVNWRRMQRRQGNK